MRLRRLAAWLGGLALAAQAPQVSPTPASAAPQKLTLTVFAAASLSEAFAQIGRRFERQWPGWTVRFNFAGSQQLATQIEHGAGADVFASADERWMGHLKERSLLAGEPTIFARNRLVVIVPRTNPARIGRLQDLARRGVRLVLGAEAVPVGRYSRQALQRLSRLPEFGADFAPQVLANVVSEEENVRSVAGKVQLGEADAGIVYRSDVSPSVSRFVRILEIPKSANVLATYPIAILKDAERPTGAGAFVGFVLSGEGQRILQRGGLIPASSLER